MQSAARTVERRCVLRSPTRVSYPWGREEMKPCALAALAASTISISVTASSSSSSSPPSAPSPALSLLSLTSRLCFKSRLPLLSPKRHKPFLRPSTPPAASAAAAAGAEPPPLGT
ncbi:hypothetical protein CLOP_g11054 [Closterium sp. NIES-67]|nr:hypothetical protein CLOP_g11054 [Closterium sp. NIES-67]